MAQNDLLDRLRHADTAQEERIPVHYFYAALVAYRDSQITRTQLENFFDIGTTGQDKVQLDWVLDKLDNAVNQERFLNAIHAVFMLSEDTHKLTKTQAQNWLTVAAS